MSPLLDRQRQGVRLGSIRIGTKVVTANGKTRPEKLDTFRLTSPDKVKVEAAAGLYGGQVKPWKPNDGAAQQWEVVTTVDRLPVRVPPGNPVEQWYEQWAATRQRLCDGVTERMNSTPCQCPADLMVRKQAAAGGGACKPITRLSLILADLPGLGVWTLSSTGDAAADELASTAELLQRAAERGAFLPALLRLEQRESRGSGTLHRFAVPVLDVQATLGALESGAFTAAAALTDGRERPALTSGAEEVARPSSAPEPLALPEHTTAQQIADLGASATHPDQLRELRIHARQVGYLEEYVDGPDGVTEPLDNVLFARYEALGGQP